MVYVVRVYDRADTGGSLSNGVRAVPVDEVKAEGSNRGAGP